MITLVTPDDLIHWAQPHTMTGAKLHSAAHGAIALPFTDTQIGPVPQDTQDGIYTLIVDTDCGCFHAAVRVNLCHPPVAKSQHTHTFPDGDQLYPECLGK